MYFERNISLTASFPLPTPSNRCLCSMKPTFQPTLPVIQDIENQNNTGQETLPHLSLHMERHKWVRKAFYCGFVVGDFCWFGFCFAGWGDCLFWVEIFWLFICFKVFLYICKNHILSAFFKSTFSRSHTILCIQKTK